MNARTSWHFNHRLYAKVKAAKMKIAAESASAIIDIKKTQKEKKEGKNERRNLL